MSQAQAATAPSPQEPQDSAQSTVRALPQQPAQQVAGRATGRASGFEHSQPGPAHVGSHSRTPLSVRRASRTGLWLICAVIFIGIAVALYWHKVRRPAEPGLPNPGHSGQVVPVPSEMAPKSQGLADPADVVAENASAASSAIASLPAMAKATLGEVAEKLESLTTSVGELVHGQSDLENRLTTAESEIAQLKEQLAKVAEPRKPVAPQRRPAPAHRPQVAAPAQVSDEAAELLSVDVWDGKPSVVVGRSRSGTRDVRFLNEGDTQGRVTVKRADVDSQRALLTTDKGEFVISRDQQ